MKAFRLNARYADQHSGKFLLRFDDTNPTKEEVEYEKMKRVTDVMIENPFTTEQVTNGRKDFYKFVIEHDKRRNKKMQSLTLIIPNAFEYAPEFT